MRELNDNEGLLRSQALKYVQETVATPIDTRHLFTSVFFGAVALSGDLLTWSFNNDLKEWLDSCDQKTFMTFLYLYASAAMTVTEAKGRDNHKQREFNRGVLESLMEAIVQSPNAQFVYLATVHGLGNFQALFMLWLDMYVRYGVQNGKLELKPGRRCSIDERSDAIDRRVTAFGSPPDYRAN